MYFEKLKNLQVYFYMLSGFQFGVNTNPNYYTSIVKISTTNNILWQASYSFNPAFKNLSVDSVEQYLYFAYFGSPVTIVKSYATNGAVVSAHEM